MSKGTEPPAHLTTTPEIRAWWDDQRSMVGDAAKTSQEAPGAKQSGIDGGKVAESPKTAVQAPQAAKVAINLPPPPDWNQRYAEASDKAARDIAVERLAAGPAPVPAKPAEDVVAKAEADAKALDAAMRESRERETARMKERAKQDSEKYGPRVAAASEEIIRGTVVSCESKGGRLNAVVDCGNGRYRVAALPISANVTPGQTGELRQQKNGIYSFTASIFRI